MRPWTLAITALASATAIAQVPQQVGYQGRLLKADGTPEAGVTTLAFSIYGVATGGAPLWTETQQVALADGFYSAFLGAVTPFSTGLWDGADK